MTKYKWPDNFDLRAHPQTSEIFKNFIQKHMASLQELDQRRAMWVMENLPEDYEMTYIFHTHSQRVAEDIRKTAKHMGLPELICENLYWGMLPHDIGKTKLPLELWDMVEKPEDHVKAMRRTHTEKGAVMVEHELADIDHPFKDLMLDIMLNHHEQMNGKGYRGIAGERLSGPVRLACIVESYDGYSIPRPHFGDRDVSVPGVLKRMREEKGADLYDMDLFEAFAEMKMAEYNEQA